MSDRALNAKSIHTLFCPFNFDNGITDIKTFIDEFSGYGWKLKNMDYSQEEDFLRKRENFMRYQYFTGAARDIFCKGAEGSCTVYEYGNATDYSYYIQTTDKQYELPIDEIELHLYDCGLGILLIRFLNEKYTDLSDIKKNVFLIFAGASKIQKSYMNRLILLKKSYSIIWKNRGYVRMCIRWNFIQMTDCLLCAS